MERNSASETQFAVQFYRYDLLTWRREQLGISIQETARRAGERFQTVRQVFKGNATNKKVWPVVKVLGLDWEKVHNLDLQESEFHLAILNGANGKAHSLGEEEAGL